jgi:uncharacterized protein (DUF58 family)
MSEPGAPTVAPRMSAVERLLAAREALAQKSGKIDWARLNHILIPLPTSSRAERQRLSRAGRFLWGLYSLFTPEGRGFFVVVLLVGVFGVDVYATQIYMLSNVLFGVLAAAIVTALLSRRARTEVALRVPVRVAANEPFEAVVDLKCDPARPPPGAVRLGRPFLPYFATWTATAPYAPPWEDGRARVVQPVMFKRRGDFTLDSFTAYEIAPFGLTQRRVGESQAFSIRVVPKPANVVALKTPLASKHQPGGVALASKTGESMELLGVRDYRRGDRLRDISARAWARTGKPAVREYREEYFSRIGVFLDTDGSLYDDAAFEAAIELAAGIVRHLSRGEALIDLLVAGDRVQTLLLGRSLGYLEQALDFLATVEKSPPFDREALLAQVAPHTEQLSCAVVISGEWGENQAALASELEAHGVRIVRVVVASDDGDAGKAGGAGGITTLTTSQVRGGEPLIL